MRMECELIKPWFELVACEYNFDLFQYRNSKTLFHFKLSLKMNF